MIERRGHCADICGCIYLEWEHASLPHILRNSGLYPLAEDSMLQHVECVFWQPANKRPSALCAGSPMLSILLRAAVYTMSKANSSSPL